MFKKGCLIQKIIYVTNTSFKNNNNNNSIFLFSLRYRK